MGFMDKLKEIGTGALKGALTMASTSYGVVLSGKHKLCKVSMNKTSDTLMFIKVASVEKQYVIKDSIKTFTVYGDDDAKSYHCIKIEFSDGETSVVHLEVDKKRGSALPTAAERVAAQYTPAARFVSALAHGVPELSDSTKAWVNKIMRFANHSEI